MENIKALSLELCGFCTAQLHVAVVPLKKEGDMIKENTKQRLAWEIFQGEKEQDDVISSSDDHAHTLLALGRVSVACQF